MKKYAFLMVILLMFLTVFIPPAAQCTDTTKVQDKEDVIYPDFKDETGEPFLTQDFQPPVPQQPSAQNIPTEYAAMNPIDYGLVGAVTLGVMGLLTYMIKSDRSDRKELRESMRQDRKELITVIEKLSSNIDAQRQSQDRLASEIHSMLNVLQNRVDVLEDSIKRLEDTIRSEARRS